MTSSRHCSRQPHDLAEAEARFRQAQALVRQERAAYFPTVTPTASVARTQPVAATIARRRGRTITEYSLGGDASWEADCGAASGRLSRPALRPRRRPRRTWRALGSVAAQLAADYFQLRSFDAELALFEQTIDAYQRAATLTRNQYNAGIVSRADVEQAERNWRPRRHRRSTSGCSGSARARDRGPHRRAASEPVARLDAARRRPSDHPAWGSVADARAAARCRRRPSGGSPRPMPEIGVASAAFFPAITLNAQRRVSGRGPSTIGCRGRCGSGRWVRRWR